MVKEVISEEDFMNAVDRAVEVLQMGKPQVTPALWTAATDRIDYVADLDWEGEAHVDLQLLGGFEDSKYLKNLRYSIDYRNSYGLLQFTKYGEYADEARAPSFCNWLEPYLHEIVRSKKDFDLDFMFGDRPVNIHGIKGVTNRSALWFFITLNGYASLGPERILVYRMRHIDDDGHRSFSYAVFVMYQQAAWDYSSWSLYPDFVGLDSGTAKGGYEFVEHTLREVGKRTEVDITEFQVPIPLLEQKMLQWQVGKDEVLFTLRSDEDLDPLKNPSTDSCLDQELRKGTGIPKLWRIYASELSRVRHDVESSDYQSALRDLLALVEDAGRRLCLERGVDLPDKSTISKIRDGLVSSGMLDGRLREWFNAFASFSSRAKHEIYPTNSAMKSFQQRMRIRMTLLMGKHLLSEIFSVMREHRDEEAE